MREKRRLVKYGRREGGKSEGEVKLMNNERERNGSGERVEELRRRRGNDEEE